MWTLITKYIFVLSILVIYQNRENLWITSGRCHNLLRHSPVTGITTRYTMMLSRLLDIQLNSQTVCHGKHINIHGENHYSDGL